MAWFRQKKVCTHCNKNKTKREFEGQPTCGNCEIEILMGREKAHICPVDGSQMKKESHEEIIIDRCPTCNGVWLDAGELKAIQEAVNNEDNNFATGLAVGIAIG